MDTATFVNATTVRVKEAIDAAERSNAWVSRKTLIPLSTLTRKLAGDRNGFTLAQLHAIASALDVPPSSLLPAESVSTAA